MHAPRLATITTIAALAFTAPTTAQQTWTVGLGGQFTTLQPAIDAASPGDTILVEPGLYPQAVVDKGIRILGSGSTLQPSGSVGIALSARHLPAGQTLVVRGLRTTIGHAGIQFDFEIHDCAGEVVLEDCNLLYALEVARSAKVTLRDVSVGTGSIEIFDSTVSLSGCRAQGAALPVFALGLRCENSDVIATDCDFTGGGASILGNAPAPAALLDGGSLTLAGATVMRAGLGSGLSGPTPIAAIETTAGALIVDPSVTLEPNSGGPRIGGAVTPQLRPVAVLRGTVDQQILQLVLTAPGASTTWVLGATPRGLPLPTPFGSLWIPPLHAPLIIGATPDALGRVVRSLSVAGIPAGMPFVFQGALVRNGALELSTPLTRTLN